MMESQHECGPVDLMRFEHLEIEKKRPDRALLIGRGARLPASGYAALFLQ